jgi:pyruvate kinase
MIQGTIGAAHQEGYAKKTDKVVVVAGLPVNSPFSTNSIRVHVIGNVLGRGLSGFGSRCTGRIIKADTLSDASLLLRNNGGEILLTHTLDESFIPIVRIVDGIILEGNTELSREMIRLINPNVVFIARVHDAMKRIEDRLIVTLDGEEKNIYEGSL